jgi:hypothetical protein
MLQSGGLEKTALDDKFCQLCGVWLIKIGISPQAGSFEMDWQNKAIKLFHAFGRCRHIWLFDVGQDRHIMRRRPLLVGRIGEANSDFLIS